MLSVMLISLLLTPTVSGIAEISKTGLGTISGTTESYNLGDGMSKNVDVFKGVPYTEPLDMSQRFQYARPQTPIPDDVNLFAHNFGYSCPQQCSSIEEQADEAYFGYTVGSYSINENCLTLNIYRPTPDQMSTSVTYPVIIWIHGGAFLSGAGSDYDGGTLAAYADVIVVTINYRLGAFGFLSSDTPINIGLNDQSLAIKWVRDNIQAFGGDINRITLAGAGAGAESITYHMLQNKGNEYFKRVIAFSGVISEDKIVKNPSEVAEVFIEAVCPPDDNENIECLKELEIEQIVKGPVIDEGGSIISYFGPTAGEETKSIGELLESSEQAEDYDLMVGVTEYDASVYIDYLKDIGEIDDGVSKSLFSDIEDTISNFYNYGTELVSAIITNSYTYWSDPDSDIYRLDELKKLLNDWFYVKPATELIRARTSSGSRQTFYMVFDHNTGTSERSSVANSEMVPYIFGNPFQSTIRELFDDDERMLSRRMMNYVKGFAYYGNPTYGLEEEWEPYSTDEKYLYVALDNSTVKQRYQAETMAAWLDILPWLMQTQETAVQDARRVDVLGSMLSVEEAEDVISALVFALIGLVAAGILIGTILLALRKKQEVTYDMMNNDQKKEIPTPPIYTPPSTLQKPNAELMATPVVAPTPTIENHTADPLPDYNEHIYDNRPIMAEMHTVPPEEDDENAQRPVSFSTFSGTDSGLVNEDEQERPDSALEAFDNLGYEDSP